MQSKKHSFIESVTNILVGYSIAILSQIVIFPFYGVHIDVISNMKMGVWFTFISIIRSYVIRRFFTKRTESVQA